MNDYEILCECARELIEASPDYIAKSGVEEFLQSCEARKHELAVSPPQAGRGKLIVGLSLKITSVREGRYSVPSPPTAPEKGTGKPNPSSPHRNCQCPKCAEWIAMLKTTPEDFDCPWCKAPLRDMGVLLHLRKEGDESCVPASAYQSDSITKDVPQVVSNAAPPVQSPSAANPMAALPPPADADDEPW